MANKDPMITEAAKCLLAKDRRQWRQLHRRLSAKYSQRKLNQLLAEEKKRLRSLEPQTA